MKGSLIALALWAEGVVSVSVGTKEKRQQSGLGGLISTIQNPGYGRVAAPAGSAPAREDLPSPVKVPGVTNMKRVKIRAGPYKVPDMGTKSKTGHMGMLESYYDNAPKPCEGNCVIYQQEGGLEYVNGTNANIDTGLWLHHMVHFNEGPGRWDPVAHDNMLCLPHVGFGSNPRKSERYFVTGNERLPFKFYNEASGQKTGYQLRKEDKFTYLIELMNMRMTAETVYLTMVYDIAEGGLPQGFKDTKTVFLDAVPCGTSETHPPQETGSFSLASKPWKPNVEGPLVHAVGHLHDGGVTIDIDVGKNNSLCRSVAKYSEKPEYVYTGAPMGDGEKIAKDHISSMAECEPQNWKVKEMKKTQSWSTTGHYDYDERAGNIEGGKQGSVMAIAIALVAVDSGVKPLSTGQSGTVGAIGNIFGMLSAPKRPVAAPKGSSAPSGSAAPAAPEAAGHSDAGHGHRMM